MEYAYKHNSTQTRSKIQRSVMTWGIGLLALALYMLVSISQVLAADEVTRSHQIDIEDQQTLTIENGVGRIEVRAHDQAQVYVEVKIEAGRQGIFRRKVDVSNTDITIEHNAREVRLALKEDNVSANWIVYVPELKGLKLDNGVGQIKVDWLNSGLDLNVGVGDVRVVVDIEQLGDFKASVGVGSIKADGRQQYNSSRRVVAESSSGRGHGNQDVTIEVGVGDIQLTTGRAR